MNFLYFKRLIVTVELHFSGVELGYLHHVSFQPVHQLFSRAYGKEENKHWISHG